MCKYNMLFIFCSGSFAYQKINILKYLGKNAGNMCRKMVYCIHVVNEMLMQIYP